MATASLNYRYFGTEGHPPLVILHGLLGSSRNWRAAAQALSEQFDVFALDLRNHGDSPHTDEHTYTAMAGDVLAWLRAQALGPVWLVGHSLGGKVGMRLAAHHPELLKALVVIDISPKDNPPYNARAFAAMNTLDLGALERREDAEAHLLAYGLKDEVFRKFILSTLVREPDGGFRWRHNQPALSAALAHMGRNSLGEDDVYTGPTLFIRGESSPFIEDSDAPGMAKHCPGYMLTTVANSGHNVHTDNLQGLIKAVELFHQRVDGGG